MRVLVFGDSITQGFWDSEGGWVSRIRKYYDQQAIDGIDNDPPTVFNLGVSGESSDDLIKRLDAETRVRASGELAILMSIGVNDARTKAGVDYSDIDRYRQNLGRLLKIADNFSDRIMFIGLTPCIEERTNPVSWGETSYRNERIKDFDNTLQEFCRKNQTPHVDIFGPFSEALPDGELLPDGLHPNDAGHQLIADLVMTKLQSLLHK